MRLKYIAILLIFLFIIGCSSTNNSTTQSIQKDFNQIETLPNWIMNPNQDNFICAVGSSIIEDNIYTTTKTANIKAKAKISEQINVYINSQSILHKKCNTDECKKTFSSKITQQSTNMLTNIKELNNFKDIKNNIYYTRICTPKINLSKGIQNTQLNQNIRKKSLNTNKYETTKISCIQQSNYPNKTLDQQKQILIKQSKFEALGELYGHLLYSKSDIKNGNLTDETIKQRAIGNIRIKGNPSFYNGSNLGEICSNITAYITKKDIEKFKPKKVKLNNFCYNNPSTPTNQIKEKANYQAYKQSLVKYKPSLKNISDESSTKLIHGFEKSNEKFDFNTGVYCFDAVSTILPYELELFNTNKQYKNQIQEKEKKVTKDLVHGLKVSFFDKFDTSFNKPIYKNSIKKAFWLKNNSFINRVLEKDKIYLVKLEGFLKPNEDINSLKLLADVYGAKVYIDNKLVLDERKLQSNKSLKANKLYKLKVELKTANAYDIALMKKTKSSSFVVFNLDEIFN